MKRPVKHGCGMLKKRGGQISIFLILSILILVGGFVIFNLRSSDIEADINPELMPLKIYIEGCMKSTAYDALYQIGNSGGYISIPLNKVNNPRSYLPLDPSGLIKLPFWWYDGISSIPSENFVVKQIEDYINDNMKTCINEFAPFKNQFNIFEHDVLLSKVVLTEEDIVVDVNYPLSVSYRMNNSKLFLNKFTEVIPIRLKKILQTAKVIMEQENNDYFFEKKTIDMMSMNRDIPTTDIEATCEKKTWNLYDVSETIKQSLQTNLPFVRIIGADYEQNLYVPTPETRDTYEHSYFQHHYRWDVTDDNLREMSIHFSYDSSWPFDINARPRVGSALESNSMKGTEMISWLCIHIWHFTYDIVYPVKGTIIDKKTKDHDEYIFNFAFKVSIDHNRPARVGFINKNFDTFETTTSEEFCSNVRRDITILARSEGDMSYDLVDVNLSLTCGRYTCDLGKTEYLSNGAVAGIEKKMPYCVNGILRAKKPGFKDTEMFIQTDRERIYTIFMKQLKTFNDIKVVKHPFSNPGTSSELSGDEQVSISISSEESDFDFATVYPPINNIEVSLLSDQTYDYNVNLYLLEDNELKGGYQGTISLHPDEIINSDRIIFHVLEYDGTSEDDKLLFISGLESYSNNIPKPEFK